MYLAKDIDAVLESKKDRLIGRSSYFHVCHVLNRSFQKIHPFKFKFETYTEYQKNDYSISGLYDHDTVTKYIIFNFSKSCKFFHLPEKGWKEFKFGVSQVCQHESIHECQWQHRDDSMYERAPLEFRSALPDSKEEEMEYLSDTDEIDAYAHDIAMEIMHYYPKKNPYEVLRNIQKHRKLWSYTYYKKTFKGEDWDYIKHLLYKKTYKWIPYVHV